jgi:hypothetical protein
LLASLLLLPQQLDIKFHGRQSQSQTYGPLQACFGSRAPLKVLSYLVSRTILTWPNMKRHL